MTIFKREEELSRRGMVFASMYALRLKQRKHAQKNSNSKVDGFVNFTIFFNKNRSLLWMKN